MSNLERELLLSQGGGIYYDDARVSVDKSCATLFIGLGGTGADMLIRVKNQVKRRLEPPKNEKGQIMRDIPWNIGFLVIDTDENAAKKIWGSATFDKNEEFCSIYVNNPSDAVSRIKVSAQQGDPIWSWYDGMGAIAALPGAGGIRQMGRFMLFQNMDRVWETLRSKIQKLLTDSSATKLNVMICTGIAGGTGSGTFIDMAYIIHHIINQEISVPSKTVYGYIAMPDVNLLNLYKDELQVNGYAALKELDYWMSSGSDEQDDGFEQVYPNGKHIKMNEKLPFDYCHLISAQITDGALLSYEEVMDTFADNVFAYVAGEVGAGTGMSAMASLYSNIGTYAANIAAASKYPACYRYLAVGTEKIEIPFEEILTLFAARLFQSLRPTAEKKPNEALFESDIEILGLSKKLVNRMFTKDVPRMPIDIRPLNYGNVWGKNNNVQQTNHDFEMRWLPEAKKKAAESAESFVQDKYAQFLTFARDCICDSNKGPCYLAAFISSDTSYCLDETLKQLVETCRSEAKRRESLSEELRENIEARRRQGTGALLGRQQVTQRYVDSLREWQHNKLAIVLYEMRADKLEELADKLKKLHREVFKPLADIFAQLPEIFIKNLEYMELEREKAERENNLRGRLIWPQEFETMHEAQFRRILAIENVALLKSIPGKLKEWVGLNFEDIAYGNENRTKRGIDVAGFISRFISDKFQDLLKIDMEQVMQGKLDGAQNLQDYVKDEFYRLRQDSQPMFNSRSDGLPGEESKFALISAPQTCQQITAVVDSIKVSGRENLKRSAETNRFYIIRIMAGLPLYTYQPMEGLEKKYEEMTHDGKGIGVHLRGIKDKEYLPSPLHEGSWTPNTYENQLVAKKNSEVREQYTTCINSDAKVIQQINGTWTLLATKNEQNPNNMRMDWKMSVDLRNLGRLQNDYWNIEDDKTDKIPLIGISQYKQSGFEPYANSMESVLRLPKKNQLIAKQADILKMFDDKRQQLESPDIYAKACISALVIRQSHYIVLKKSTADPFPLELGAARGELLHEFEIFEEFKSFLTTDMSENIKTIYKGIMDTIGSVASEDEKKIELLSRIDGLIEKHTNGLQILKSYLQELTPDDRQEYRYAQYFYETLLITCNNTKLDLEEAT